MKKKIITLLILLLTVFTTPVFAKGDNGFISGDKVKVKKDLNTTSFVAGNSINITSNIEGINFAAGNNITISSTQDYIFTAGNMITVKNATTKDAFIAGNVISIENSNIRDLYVGGSNITIDSNIERNAYIAGETVTINGKIDGDVKIAAKTINIEEGATINGTLEYPDDGELNIEKGATISKKKEYKSTKFEVKELTTKQLVISKITSAIYSYISLLIVATILLLIFKKFYPNITKMEKSASEILKNSGIGLIMLIFIPIAALVVMLTIVGFPLSIITLIIYGILIYLSSIATASYVGSWAFKDKIKNSYLQLVVALAIIYVLGLIPYIGGLVRFISLIFGLGTYGRLIVAQTKSKK